MEIIQTQSQYTNYNPFSLIIEGACVGITGAVTGIVTGLLLANQEEIQCQTNGPEGCMDSASLNFVIYPVVGIILGSITTIALDALRHSRNSKNQMAHEYINFKKV